MLWLFQQIHIHRNIGRTVMRFHFTHQIWYHHCSAAGALIRGFVVGGGGGGGGGNGFGTVTTNPRIDSEYACSSSMGAFDRCLVVRPYACAYV